MWLCYLCTLLDELDNYLVDNQRAILQSIADDLRCCLPLEAMFPSETMAVQTVCSFLVVFWNIIFIAAHKLHPLKSILLYRLNRSPNLLCMWMLFCMTKKR